jgi:hypothetical protein
MINNPGRGEACKYKNDPYLHNKVKEKFIKGSSINTDYYDIWGKNISMRDFYTMPNTKIVNNQMEFARFLFNMENSGNCKQNKPGKCYNSLGIGYY